MFIYQYSEKDYLVFVAVNNAALSIATMWYDGLIDNKNFSATERHIIVHVVNERKFDFVVGKSYHLFLKPNDGRLHIYMALDHWQYVAVYYRMAVDNTGNSLFDSTPRYIDESVYFNE